MTTDPHDSDLPARFYGAWERRALTIDGVAAPDAGRAVWVQAGALFVDVRGPGGFASDTCFAGSTKWSEPYLVWKHVIDRAGTEDGADAGHITFDGDDLIERGSFIAGHTRDYSERWTPLGGRSAPLLAASSAGGFCVRVGDHAAAVVDQREAGGTFAAAYWHWSGTDWQVELAVDSGPSHVPRPLEPDAVLDDGWQWQTNAEVRA